MKNLPIILLAMTIALGCNFSFNSSSNSQSNGSTNPTNKPTAEKPKEVVKNTDSLDGNRKTIEAGGGNCSFKEEMNAFDTTEFIKEYPISLNGGDYRVEFSQTLDKTKASPGFSVSLYNSKVDADSEQRLKVISGGFGFVQAPDDFETDDKTKYKMGDIVVSKDLTGRYDRIRVQYGQGIRVNYIGDYEVKLVGPGCEEKRTITESESKFEGGECEFMDTVEVRQKYSKDYPISLKNGGFHIEFAPVFDDNPSYKYTDFGAYLYDSKTDPKGEQGLQVIDGTTKFVGDGNEFESSIESPNKKYQKGQAITSKPIPDTKYDRIRVTYWNGSGGPIVGSYRVKIVGAGCGGN